MLRGLWRAVCCRALKNTKTRLDICMGTHHVQETGPDLIGLLVSNGGFATAVHARQLHTAAAIAVHLLKVSHWPQLTCSLKMMLLMDELALQHPFDADGNWQHTAGVPTACMLGDA